MSEEISGESIDSSSQDDSTESTDLSGSEVNGSAGEAVEELQESLEAAAKDGATKKELQEMIEEFELKVNGKTIKHKLDWNDKESIKAALQKSYAFNDVSNEYANVRKGLNTKIETWKKDPSSIFKDLELNKQELLEQWVKEELEELELDPKDKAIRERDAKLKAYEEKEQMESQKREQEARERADSEALDALRGEIRGALESHSFLKPSEKLERRVADMMASFSGKYPDVTAEQVLPHVENDIIEEFNELIESIPEEFIEKLLRVTSLEKIGKKAPKPVAKPKAKVVPQPTSQVAIPTAASAQQKAAQQVAKKRSFEDVFSAR